MGESSYFSSRVESESFRSGFESSQVESPVFPSRVESSQVIFFIFSFSVYFIKNVNNKFFIFTIKAVVQSKQLVNRMRISVEKLTWSRNNNVKWCWHIWWSKVSKIFGDQKFWHPLYKRLYYSVIENMMYDAMQIFHLFYHIQVYTHTRRLSFTTIWIHTSKKDLEKVVRMQYIQSGRKLWISENLDL